MDTEKRLWHTLESDRTLSELKSSRQQGLSGAEAAQRLEQYGPNALSEGKKKTVLQVFLEQFKDLMVMILIVAALISLATGEAESTIVIFAVLILNAVLGTVQHFKAEKSLESLKAMSAPSAKVIPPCPRPRWFPATSWSWRPATWWWLTAGFWRITP